MEPLEIRPTTVQMPANNQEPRQTTDTRMNPIEIQPTTIQMPADNHEPRLNPLEIRPTTAQIPPNNQDLYPTREHQMTQVMALRLSRQRSQSPVAEPSGSRTIERTENVKGNCSSRTKNAEIHQ